MSQHSLAPEARAALRRDYLIRLRSAQLARTAHKFTPSPAKARLSTRGQYHPSWYTKRHTPSRQRDLMERRAV